MSKNPDEIEGTSTELPTYKCTICGNDHEAGMHCGRHILALRAMLALYAETMEKMHAAPTKKLMGDAYKSLVFGKPEGDLLAASLMMVEANKGKN